MGSQPINRSLAIIIGINQYKFAHKLNNAVNDANEMAKILKTKYGYQVLKLINEQANLENIYKQLDACQQGKTINFSGKDIKIEPTDRVLFYFAGHGVAENAEDSENGKPAGYIMAQDSKKEVQNTRLSMQSLYEQLTKIKCHHLLMILDCCFAGSISWVRRNSGGFAKKKTYKENYDRFIKYPVQLIITSSAYNEEARDGFGVRKNEENGHSPFAYALLKALNDNKDLLTAHGLFDKIQTGIATKEQTPGLLKLEKDYKGEYVFLLPEFDPDTLPQAPAIDPKNNPYRGLEPYGRDDSKLFFGRDDLIQELYQKVNEQSLTVVIGKSGVGKSSLVKAGLIPKLADKENSQQHWKILEMRPGVSPFEQLNNTLQNEKFPNIGWNASNFWKDNFHLKIEAWVKNNPQIKLLLFIDQSEELITLCKKNQERENFLNLLMNLSSSPSLKASLRIVLTLREDFVKKLELLFKNQKDKKYWSNAQIQVPKMETHELRQVIEKSANERAVFFNPPSLVDDLLNEVGDISEALPLLSFTLSELYLISAKESAKEGIEHREFTKSHYEELGGVKGSLAKKANSIYDKLILTKEIGDIKNLRGYLLELLNKEKELLSLSWKLKNLALQPEKLSDNLEKFKSTYNKVHKQELEEIDSLKEYFTELLKYKQGVLYPLNQIIKSVSHKQEFSNTSEATNEQQNISLILEKLHSNLREYYDNLKKTSLKVVQDEDKLKQESAAYQKTIMNVMLRMVSLEVEDILARRSVPKFELDYPEPENQRVEKVLEEFKGAHLIKNKDENNTYIEPTHEALVLKWDKIQEWVNNQVIPLQDLQRLARDAGYWEKNKKNPDKLWHSSNVDLAENLRKNYKEYLNKLECEFIEHSLKNPHHFQQNVFNNKHSNVPPKTSVSSISSLSLLNGSRSIIPFLQAHKVNISLATTLAISMFSISGFFLNSPKTNANIDNDYANVNQIDVGKYYWIKEEGIKAVNNGEFDKGIKNLQDYLEKIHNIDPEALIYLNNARIGNRKSYTIAASVPKTANVNISLELLRGVAQAQDEINKAGGINNVPLRILIKDDGNNINTATKIAEELVKNSDVLGVVGHYSSDVSLKAGKIYEKSKLVAISPVSTSVKLTGFGHYIFRTVPNDALAAEVLAQHMKEQLQKKKAVVFYNSNSEYSKSLKYKFAQVVSQPQQGGKVLEEFDLSKTDFDAEDSIKQSIQAGAEVVVLLPNSGTLDNAIQVINANRQQLPLLGGDDLYLPKILKHGAANAVGMAIAVPWHILAKSSSDFPTTSRRLWKADVNWRTAMSYDATLAFIKALQQNRTPTRQGIAEALHAKSFSVNGATGEIKFESGDRSQKYPQLVKIISDRESRSELGYDFVPAQPLIVTSQWGFANLRKVPTTKAAILSKVLTGTPVTIINIKTENKTKGCEEHWYKIQVKDQVGWMCSDFLKE